MKEEATTNATPTAQLSEAGVSIWLDDLARNRLDTGSLQKLIHEKNVVGVTTNRSIFQAAITTGNDYDAKIAELAARGANVDETIFSADTPSARDVFHYRLRVVRRAGGSFYSRLAAHLSIVF